MSRTICGAAFLTLSLAILPGLAQDEKKKNADPKIEKKDNPYVTTGKLMGTIVAIEESKRSLRINIGQKTLNPVAAEAVKQAQKALARARTRQEKISAAQELQGHMKDLYVSELELQTTENVIVRVAQPPAQFDEKGRVRKYTKKELREMKGNSKLPGYQGEFSDLRQKQIVQLTLVKKKEAIRSQNARGRDADVELVSDNQPMVNMVIVLRDLGN